MDEGNQYMEILSKLGSLQAQMEEQKKSMDIVCSFKDTALRTFQNFEDYKESRKTLPAAIDALEKRTAKCNLECEHHTGETKSYFKKVDFLMTWYGRGAAIIFAFQILIALMVLLGRIIDIEYTLKP
jgi:hypothetical protein